MRSSAPPTGYTLRRSTASTMKDLTCNAVVRPIKMYLEKLVVWQLAKKY